VGVQQSTFGSPETLGYIETIVETAIDDILVRKFAVLCNYIASEFASWSMATAPAPSASRHTRLTRNCSRY
jgi:hypothetical protein